MAEQLSLVIPTKDRHNDLRRLLASIAAGEIKPVQVIIVDAGEQSAQDLLQEFSNLRLDYLRLSPPSLTVQRNAGIKAVTDQATLVGFLDDDVIVEGQGIQKMLQFWDKAAVDVAGAAFNLSNLSERTGASFMEKLFLLNSGRPGRILRSGFQDKLAQLNETKQVQWLTGCGMVWRKAIFDQFQFDEWFYGYAHCEDLDFGFRVSRKYSLFILHDAKLFHNIKAIEKEYEYHLGKMQVVNRVYFVKRHPQFSLILCYWACLGLLLKNLWLGLILFKGRYLLRAAGIFSGIFISLIRQQRIKQRIKL